MLKLLTFLTVFCATTAYAGTNQIDIIGLVPDVSTQEQVESAKAEFGYVIGGFELICIPEFIDGKLSQLLCVTGEDSASRDRTTDSYRLASNSEIHKVLVSGFTKKYGAPSKIDNSTVSNRFGTEFNRNVVVWVDNKGNKLTLMSMATKIDEGMILLESANQLKKDKAESNRAESKRDF
jgi:hypothetical protein